MVSVSEVEALFSRADSLVSKFNSLEGTRNHIDEAVTLNRQALALCQSGHTMRASSLSRLSINLSNRYKRFGDLKDIEEGIVLDRAALELRPLGHPDRYISLVNLGHRLSTRYHLLGAMEDLDEAINLGRDALMHCPPGHYYHSMSLSNLGSYLGTRYERFGAIEDLDEAIALDRDALALRPLGHPDRSMSLNNLAAHLGIRYKKFNAVEDLREAIALDRDALVLRPPGHPDRPMSLNNLAVHLNTQYKNLGAIDDLDEAIALDRDALVICPLGHHYRSVTLNNLAIHLHARYQALGAIKDLDESIGLDRDALVLRPPGHPLRFTTLSNLAVHLHGRYQKLNVIEDLDSAIELARDVLALYPLAHPDRSQYVENLVVYLSSRFSHLGQLKDKEEIFSLYSRLMDLPSVVSSSDLSAAQSWIARAEQCRHSTTVIAYETTLQLLTHHLAALPALPQHLTLVRDITSSLAVDAFSACLRNSSPMKAVELLEQGRGVFLGQLTRLRSPVNDAETVGPEGETLAKEFLHIASLIRKSFDSSSANQHDRVCSLNVKLQRVTSSIRKLPGLSRFLLHPLYHDLQCAAACGPVIVVNACQYGCDALIVSLGCDPIHVALQISREEVRALTTELYLWTKQAKMTIAWKYLAVALRQLWDKVVSPIADVLQTILPPQSRVWWCPTSEFILLPLHAAGTYRNGQPKFSDLYVSSYTPSLSALIHARRCSPTADVSHGKHFVAIGQANAAGESKLQSVGMELTNIGERINGLATFTQMEGSEASISHVIDAFSVNDWVHLACHGLPNREQPFKSAFGLHDGRLTIERIIQCELEHPEFAYLSACHTMVGDKECPDEMIHLASAMQFVGFRSVIGTLWAVDDVQTLKITSRFYEKVRDESGRLDHTRAAVSLHETMKELERKVAFDQRILYVHLGA